MAKPRRKHPGFSVIQDSPQGNCFLMLAQVALGSDSLTYAPIESLKDGTHFFVFRAPAGLGLFVERKEEAQGNEWFHRYGFLFESTRSAVSWQLELDAYRWDPWLHAKSTGDATVRDSQPGERRRVTDALRAEGGSRKDKLVVTVLPCDSPQEHVAGVPRAVVEEVLVKHGLREGVTVAFDEAPGEQGGAR